VETSRAEAAEALLAPLASPTLTGTPTAPTKTALTSNTDVATTAYTDSAVGVETTRAEAAEALLAPLASPALTGAPTAPTATALTNSTVVASTAYTDTAVTAATTTLTALAAAACYGDAQADGYAAWTFNPNSGAVTTSSGNLGLGWPAGAINLTKLVLPVALTSINGYLSWVWRAGTGTSMANCYIGFFGPTGTRIANSPDQSALGASLQRMSLGVTSLAAGTYWVSTLVGTQGGTTNGGPTMAVGEVSSGGYAPHTGYTGAVRAVRLTGSATATPASLTISGGAPSGYSAMLYANGWFAID
jgi:hypothetical protein